MNVSEFKQKYLNEVAPELEALVGDERVPRRLVVKLERMLIELEGCSCGGSTPTPVYAPWYPAGPYTVPQRDWWPTPVWCDGL